LINVEVNTNIENPNDSSYVFNMFSPIIVRLLEAFIKKGWGPIKEDLRKIQGATDFPLVENEIMSQKKGKINFILVVFIGGITYAELAAIRWLNKNNKEIKFFILTTHIVSGRKIIDSLKLNFENKMTMSEFSSQLNLK
jgi:hypothetical protein